MGWGDALMILLAFAVWGPLFWFVANDLSDGWHQVHELERRQKERNR